MPEMSAPRFVRFGRITANLAAIRYVADYGSHAEVHILDKNTPYHVEGAGLDALRVALEAAISPAPGCRNPACDCCQADE